MKSTYLIDVLLQPLLGELTVLLVVARAPTVDKPGLKTP